MAILKTNNKAVELPDGSPIKDAAEELGVPFACSSGMCAICRVEIEEGANNLEPLNENEEALGMDEQNRLACQCKIKSGTVKIKF